MNHTNSLPAPGILFGGGRKPTWTQRELVALHTDSNPKKPEKETVLGFINKDKQKNIRFQL